MNPEAFNDAVRETTALIRRARMAALRNDAAGLLRQLIRQEAGDSALTDEHLELDSEFLAKQTISAIAAYVIELQK